MNRYLLCLLYTMWWLGTNAQTTPAETLQNDTARVNRMIEQARNIQYIDPQKTDQLLTDIRNISEAIDYKLGLAAFYSFKASRYSNQMQLDSAKTAADKALKLLSEDQSVAGKNQSAVLYNTYGVIYQQKQLYDSAVSMYLKSVKIADETQNHSRKFYGYANLSVLYSFLNDTLKTERYARLSLAEAKLTTDTVLILRATVVLLNNFAQYYRYDSIPLYVYPALKMAEARGDMPIKAKLLHFIGDYYSHDEKGSEKANTYFQQALQLFRNLKSPYDEAVILFSIGNNFVLQKKYIEAIDYLEQAVKICEQLDLIQLKTETLKSLSTAVAETGDYRRAYLLMSEYVPLKDSLDKRTNEEMVQTLETRFQLRNKDDIIALQEAQIRQKNLLNYILAGGAVALILILILGYLNYANRQKLQKQRISELETEKQLLATQSLIKGQEDERNRLAKDLHDGLGGLLSGVKLQLGAMKGNLILTEEHGRVFNNALNKLDESINEMRRVAHNMMPEALMNLGLQQALQDYCDGLAEGQAFTINCAFHGLEQRMEPSVEVVLYRIVQELLNNAVKHADAGAILAQVMRQDNHINITVEDNGKGFDTTQLNSMRTAGLRNIQSRVNYLHGKMDIKSTPGKGTSIFVDCLIEQHG